MKDNRDYDQKESCGFFSQKWQTLSTVKHMITLCLSPIKNLDYGTKAQFLSFTFFVFATLFHHSMSQPKQAL